MRSLFILAAALVATACVEGTTVPEGIAYSGTFGLDSVGNTHMPFRTVAPNGETSYIVSVVVNLNQGTYIGTERDSTYNTPSAHWNVTESTLTGDYHTSQGPNDEPLITVSGMGTGHTTANGFTIEGGQQGTLYFGKR